MPQYPQPRLSILVDPVPGGLAHCGIEWRALEQLLVGADYHERIAVGEVPVGEAIQALIELGWTWMLSLNRLIA